MKRPELLSPAGDREKLETALQYGADAVYLAGEEFGMRIASENFTQDSIADAIDYAHKAGASVYVTLNTMPRNDEVARLPEFLEILEDAKADGAIVADIGVLNAVKKYAPNVKIHISTQASIVNYQSANAWHDLGADRIVLARELSLEEIREIRSRTPDTLEIEAFVHGAMCMSYSGRCMLSTYMTGRDSNRGRCAQPCRWKYAVMEEKRPGEYYPIEEDGAGTYIFNSKDMCMIEHIPELIEAGIDSFKIEGRVKSAFYNATITNAYRMAIDSYLENPDSWNPKGPWAEEVHKVSHREYFTGFYFGEKPSEYHLDSMYIRDWDVAAMVLDCDAEGNARISVRNRFFAGDDLEILEPKKPTVAFKAEMTDLEGQPLEVARHAKMEAFIKLPRQAVPGAILRVQRAEK